MIRPKARSAVASWRLAARAAGRLGHHVTAGRLAGVRHGGLAGLGAEHGLAAQAGQADHRDGAQHGRQAARPAAGPGSAGRILGCCGQAAAGHGGGTAAGKVSHGLFTVTRRAGRLQGRGDHAQVNSFPASDTVISEVT